MSLTMRGLLTAAYIPWFLGTTGKPRRGLILSSQRPQFGVETPHETITTSLEEVEQRFVQKFLW